MIVLFYRFIRAEMGKCACDGMFHAWTRVCEHTRVRMSLVNPRWAPNSIVRTLSRSCSYAAMRSARSAPISSSASFCASRMRAVLPAGFDVPVGGGRHV